MSALPWKMIKESKSSLQCQKREDQKYHKRNQCVGRLEEMNDPLMDLLRFSCFLRVAGWNLYQKSLGLIGGFTQ